MNGSFRDPSGYVYEHEGRVFRTITGHAVEEYCFVRDNGILDELFSAGVLVRAKEVDPREAGIEDDADMRLVVEHPRLDFVSYPYEWPFEALKAAALHHLDLQIRLFGQGIVLSDATAYNIQFRGAQPTFIDLLSLRRYREGEYWTGYRQFCEQFLNPLLLRALTGIPYNEWYRGRMEGILAEDLSRALPLSKKFSPRTFAHVVMHGRLQSSGAAESNEKIIKPAGLSKNAYLGILHQMHAWISGLTPKGKNPTVWQDYVDSHSYSDDEYRKKKQIVSEFVTATQPRMLWDFGCNTGEFSETALESGAKSVVGFDFDHGALDAAFQRARSRDLNLLALLQDATNPSPSQGWNQAERDGLASRRSSDGLLGLALIHHLVIGKNIPLGAAIEWLSGLAPCGVIEFVPKEDPMVQRMLAHREDIFHGYSYERFHDELKLRADIVRIDEISQSGRSLFWYDAQRR